jgi:hypothetical protein
VYEPVCESGGADSRLVLVRLSKAVQGNPDRLFLLVFTWRETLRVNFGQKSKGSVNIVVCQLHPHY